MSAADRIEAIAKSMSFEARWERNSPFPFLDTEAALRAIAAELRGAPALTEEWTPLSLAILFHHTYEKLAPSVGYDTRTHTRVFDDTSPNGKLMVATCAEVLRALRTERTPSEGRCEECGESIPCPGFHPAERTPSEGG